MHRRKPAVMIWHHFDTVKLAFLADTHCRRGGRPSRRCSILLRPSTKVVVANRPSSPVRCDRSKAVWRSAGRSCH